MPSNQSSIRVMIAEPFEIIRTTIERQLADEEGIEVVATAADGRSALDALNRHEIDLALIEVRLPEVDGIQVLKAIIRRPRPPEAIVFTDVEDPRLIYDAFVTGAKGLLHKRSTNVSLISEVREARQPGVRICPRCAAMLRTALEQAAAPNGAVLTQRELEVLTLMNLGATRVEIANQLSISPNTVHGHLKSVYRKLGVRNHFAAVTEAQRRRLI